MRVAIDARKLHDFGIGTYTRNLLRHLARIDRESEYVLLCQHRICPSAVNWARTSGLCSSRRRTIRSGSRFHVPWVLHRERPDVFHAPHYVLPPAARCRSVVTIHDCIHLMFPQYLPSRAAYAYARRRCGWRSDGRTAFSPSRRLPSATSFISSTCRPEKIVVVYNAIDERFRAAPSEEDVARVRERYQLTQGFVLYVGNIKPHKNLVRLIEAYDMLRHRGFDDLKLLIIGDEISKLPALRRAVHKHKLHKHVRFLGYQPDETLSVLYRLAEVFVFPSLYEGFGLPPLEAMACGTPVVTSNVSSLPEVTGDAAVLVDPYEVESIAEGMHRVLTDAALSAELRAKGIARAREFSWERSVARTRELYQEVGGSN